MKRDKVTVKLLVVGLVGVACLVASTFVFSLISEREDRHNAVVEEIGMTWGKEQSVIGPMLIVRTKDANDRYILPTSLTIESTLEPEVRQRGLFEAVVYTEHIKVSGMFGKDDLAGVRGPLIFSVALGDTRSIDRQISFTWGTDSLSFNPGSDQAMHASGIHAPVSVAGNSDYPFSFELSLNGSGKVLFAPVGKETDVHVVAPWGTPEFTGAFFPADRTLGDHSFDATWKISSFGRDYPQNFIDTDGRTLANIDSSLFGVNLNEGVDLYTKMVRTTKYAILFIAITFIAFFLFEILSPVFLHPIQYLLVGLALALFYLLLLSLSEHIGFLRAYVTATSMTSLLIGAYCMKILGSKVRAVAIFLLLVVLYGYLYFVLNLEDYALLFGSFLLFVLLGSIMYITRNIVWSSLGRDE